MNYWIAICGYTNESIFPEYNKENDNTYRVLESGNVKVYYSRDGRFEHDQLYRTTHGTITVIDGVLLNLDELKQSHSCDSIEDLIDIIGDKERFFAEFRGPFSGFVYSSKNGSVDAFGNQTGDAPVFYFQKGSLLLVSNDCNLIVEFLKMNGFGFSLDEQAVLFLMTYGYMLNESTLLKEVKRLAPGRYLHFEKGEFKVIRYHTFSFYDNDISFEKAVDKVDQEFCKAIKRCFNKDIEYGINEHLVDMSGGLDTRMVNFAAKKLGYDHITNISYSQSRSDEYKYASMTSKYLRNGFIHKQLDDTLFLYEVDDLVNLNYGLTYYFGITGGRQLLSSINNRKFGLEHTGQLGDVVVGSFSNTPNHVPPVKGSSRNSKLIAFEPSDAYYSQYANNEDFTFENRGFRSVLSTHLTRRHYFYSVSPFIDVDFMEACFSIPMQYRMNHKLYWAWIDKYYPDAGAIPATRKREDKAIQIVVHRGQRYLRKIFHKLGNRIGLFKSSSVDNHMNPFEYWYETSKELREFIDKYYADNIILLRPYAQTKRNVEMLYHSTRTVDKLLALSVLGGVKEYFS